MWHVAVTVPTSHAFSALSHHVIDTARAYELLVELGVATYAVVHYHPCAGIFGGYCLPLLKGYELANMVHAVFRLEVILGEDVVVRHVAVVACGIAAMRGVHPRGVIGCHDVTVYACRGVVSEVGVHSQEVHEKPS